MTRDRPPPSGDEQEPDSQGHLQLTQPGPVVAFGLVGAVAGWAMRPVVLRLGGDEPGLSWAPALLIGFMAACLVGVAWLTRKALAERGRLEPHKAVNRMVLGKASALVAAAFLGWYAGRAIGQIGIASELAGERLLHAGVAVVTAVAMLGAALALERACLVRRDGDDDLPS